MIIFLSRKRKDKKLIMSGARDPFDDLIFRKTPGAPTSDPFTASANAFSPGSQTNRSPPPPPQRKIPQLNVKLCVHEEVASTQDKKNAMDEVSSHVLLDGVVEAQIVCNSEVVPPCSLRIFDPDYPDDTNVQFDSNCFTFYGPSEYNILAIPKSIRPGKRTTIASYHRSVTKNFMPLLVQSKISRFGDHLEKCALRIQIRSNLNNIGSLLDIILVIAVPPTVLGNTVKILPGEGTGAFDRLKRIIRWEIKELKQGNSIVFGAEVEIGSMMLVDELPKFPVLLRCRSTEDTVSSIQLDCKELDGHPVRLKVVQERSFQLLHRLPS